MASAAPLTCSNCRSSQTENPQPPGCGWRVDLLRQIENVGSATRRPQTSDVSGGTARLSSTMTSDDNVHEHNTLRPGLGGPLPRSRAAADDPPTLRRHNRQPTPAL